MDASKFPLILEVVGSLLLGIDVVGPQRAARWHRRLEDVFDEVRMKYRALMWLTNPFRDEPYLREMPFEDQMFRVRAFFFMIASTASWFVGLFLFQLVGLLALALIAGAWAARLVVWLEDETLSRISARLGRQRNALSMAKRWGATFLQAWLVVFVWMVKGLFIATSFPISALVLLALLILGVGNLISLLMSYRSRMGLGSVFQISGLTLLVGGILWQSNS